MSITKDIVVKKVGEEFEITTTTTEIIVETYSLDELKQQKIDLESSKDSLSSSQLDSMTVHNNFISEKQKQIDDATAIGT